MDELLGFEELPQPINDLILESGVHNELSNEEIVKLVLESEEFGVYNSYKNPAEDESMKKSTGTVAHALKTRKNRNK